MRLFLTFLVLLFLVLSSCMKEKEFPVEPRIAFKDFTKVIIPPDTIPQLLILSISFTDGDGDVGLDSTMIAPPYDYNLFIDVLKMKKGQLEKIIFEDSTVNFNGRIPIVAPNPDNKPIEGVIEYNFDYPMLRSFLLNDTLAFDVSLKDRALHESNTIRTPLIIID
ncbi:MAG: hypothetical protein WBJ84_07655 [Bacteroidales bacterium]